MKSGPIYKPTGANEIDWPKFLADAETLLKRLDKKYYIKRDLLIAAGRIK